MTSGTRRTSAIIFVCSTVAGAGTLRAAEAQISGAWRLNQSLSELPRQMGFDLDSSDGPPSDGRGPAGARSGRGGRGGAGGPIRVNPPSPHFESEEDARKIRELTGNAQRPSVRLTIAQTDRAVTITDDKDRTEVFHANAKEETHALEAGPIGVIAKWEAGQFVVRYLVEKDRELRFRYSRDASGRLVVRTQFAERGKGDIVTRVYDPQ